MFTEALRLLKEDKRVARKSWNYYIVLVHPKNEYKAFIQKVENGKKSPWYPDIDDILAEDWIEV